MIEADLVLVYYNKNTGMYHLLDVTTEEIITAINEQVLGELIREQSSGNGDYKLQRRFMPSWKYVPVATHKADMSTQKTDVRLRSQGKMTLDDLFT
jgi:hypothetical protein